MTATLFLTWGAVAALQIAAWPRVTADRRWRLAALAGVLGLCLAHQIMFATLAEDAFISFRYAMNLADGNGLVFNAGERVEGYSNFLWVVLIAFPKWLADADIVLVARVLGIACALGCVVLAYLLANRIAGNTTPGLLAATVTAASSNFAAYGPSGLETPLFALLVIATVLAASLGWALAAGVLVALATMTRPDGVVIAAVLGIWLIVQAIRRQQRWTAPILFTLGALALAGPWTAWRLVYYGHFVPNALAAKTGMTLDQQLEFGWRYLSGFAVAAQAMLLLVPFAALALIVQRRQTDPRARATVWLLFALAVSYVALFTVTGGDWMPGWRFYAPAMPLLAVGGAAAWSLTRTTQPDSAAPRPALGRVGPVAAASVSLLLLVVSIISPNLKPQMDNWRSQLYEMSAVGSWFHRTLPPGTVIATYANGALSYEAGPGLTVVDVLGLTDEHIARNGKRLADAPVGHAAHDYPYVVTVRRPDVVYMRGTGFSTTPVCDFMIELAGRYRSAIFRVDGSQRWASVYLRVDRADTLIPMLDADPRFELQPCPP